MVLQNNKLKSSIVELLKNDFYSIINVSMNQILPFVKISYKYLCDSCIRLYKFYNVRWLHLNSLGSYRFHFHFSILACIHHSEVHSFFYSHREHKRPLEAGKEDSNQCTLLFGVLYILLLFSSKFDP